MKADTDKQSKYEIVAVLLTAAGKFIFIDFLQWKLFLYRDIYHRMGRFCDLQK